MKHWRIVLEHYGEQEYGDVVTQDGEVIGRWTRDENDFHMFTPIGGDEDIIVDPFLGPFCQRVADWFEAQ